MTLAPIHSDEIRGVKGPPVPLAKICSVPGCLRLAQQRHHLWPKSYLRGQPYEWVLAPWGAIVANSSGMCVEHHAWVTGGPGGHKAAVLVQAQTFLWAEKVVDQWEVQGALMPQPPVMGEELHAPEHEELGEGESCPTCGYQKPARRRPGATRATSTWGVTVPKDTELGTEVLDGWVDDFAVLLGFGDEPSRLRRYHVLSVILAWASQHKPMLIEDIIESRSR